MTHIDDLKHLDWLTHPSGHDGIDVSGVMQRQRHEVGVERPDPLEHQPDVAGRGEVEQGRRRVVGAGPAVDQRRVDLRAEKRPKLKR